MAEDRWANGVDGVFSDGTKWSSGSPPSSGDDAVLNAPGTYSVIVSGSVQVQSIQTVASATLNLQGSVFGASEGTGSGVNAGHIEVTDGSALIVNGTMKNSGRIDLGATNLSSRLLLAGNTTLTGGGLVNFGTTNTQNIITSSSGAVVTLTNVDNQIVGAGELTGLDFINAASGLVNGNNAVGALYLQSDTVNNEGTIEATAVGGIQVFSSTITNHGTLKALLSGNLRITKSTVAGGVVAASTDGAKIFLSAATLTGCNVSVQRGATLSVGTANVASSISGGAFTNAGRVVIGDGAGLLLKTNVANTGGVIDIDGGSLGASLQLDSAVALTGGQLNLNNEGGTASIIGDGAGSRLANFQGVIAGVGVISSLTLVNRSGGTVRATAGTLTITPGAAASVINEGIMYAQGSGTLVFSHTAVNNADVLSATGGGTINFDQTSVLGTGAGRLLVYAASKIRLNNGQIDGGTLAIAKGGTLSADTSVNGVVVDTLTNNGTIAIADRTSLSLRGAVNHAGAISLNGGLVGATLQLGADLTLGGGGSVRLSQSSQNTIRGGYVLTNVDNTISGAGSITAWFTNQAAGVVTTANGTLTLSGILTNAGHIGAIQSGIITITTKGKFTPDTNTGMCEALDNATLNLDYIDLANEGGTIQAGTGANVSLGIAKISGGTVSILKGGKLSVSGASSILGATFTNLGTVEINFGVGLTLTGAISNQGTIDIGVVFGSALKLGGALTLSGGGTVQLDSSSATITSAGKGAPVLTNVDNTIAGFGNIGNGRLSIDNQTLGLINANDVFRLTIATGFSGSPGNLRNAGRIEATDSGGLTISNTDIQNVGGAITAIGKGALDLVAVKSTSGKITAQSHAILDFLNTTITSATLTITAGGKLEIEGTDSINGGTFINAGQTDIVDGALLSVAGTLNNSGNVSIGSLGALEADGHGLTLNGGGTVTLNSGILAADTTGLVLHNVDNTISGTGTIGGGGLSFNNDGLIDATSIVLNTGSAVILNAGTIEQTAAGGTTTITSAISNTGKLIVTAGTLAVDGEVSGDGSVQIGGGEATFDGALHEDVTFTASAGKLGLAQSQDFTGSISGFSKTGATTLDLGDIGFVSATEATFAGGVLTVTDGTHTAKIKLVGDFSKSTFVASDDGHGGTLVVDPSIHKSAASFAAAMASFDTGGGHWVPTPEIGRLPPPLLAGATSAR